MSDPTISETLRSVARSCRQRSFHSSSICSFRAEVLEQEQLGPVDEALRVALRIIEERSTLAGRMADDARTAGRVKSAAMFEDRSKDMRSYAETIRQAVLRLKE